MSTNFSVRADEVRPGKTPRPTAAVERASLVRSWFTVAGRPRTYGNLAYLLLGLPLGTVWFTALVSGFAVGASMLIVALIGVPILVGLWYVTHWFADVERRTTNVLLGRRIVSPAIRSSPGGNLWVRLRAMSSDPARQRELAFVMLRFPIGIATFSAAVVAIATPLTVAWAPFVARYDHTEPFGDWAYSSTIEDIASTSTWSWLLVPLGVLMLFGSLHLVNAIAGTCGRWAVDWLDGDDAVE